MAAQGRPKKKSTKRRGPKGGVKHQVHKTRRSTTVGPARIEELRLELLRVFYNLRDLPKARAIAAQLEQVLAASPEYGDSIRGDEVSSMLAEKRRLLTLRRRSPARGGLPKLAR